MTARIPPRALDPAGGSPGQAPVIDAGGTLVEWADVAGGGGASTLDALTDVDTSTTPPTDNQGLQWDAAAVLWVPGDFAPTSHTHAASAVTVTPTGNIAATDVQAALVELDAEKAAIGHTHTTPRVRAKVGRTANLNLDPSTTTVIPFTTETYDTDNLHDNAVNNSRVLLNRLGVWLLVGAAGFSSRDGGRRIVFAYRNGAEVARSVIFSSATSPPVVQVVTPVVATAVTDYVELVAYQDTTSSLWCEPTHTSLSVLYLGE